MMARPLRVYVDTCDGLVSWNYKHLAQPDKALLFNMVNAALGLPQLFIATPREVIEHEKGK